MFCSKYSKCMNETGEKPVGLLKYQSFSLHEELLIGKLIIRVYVAVMNVLHPWCTSTSNSSSLWFWPHLNRKSIYEIMHYFFLDVFSIDLYYNRWLLKLNIFFLICTFSLRRVQIGTCTIRKLSLKAFLLLKTYWS